ncbi:MAG: transketolase [Candidatus Eremiobacteraeota bacterium]|nr:transketolase [Candidatus Eremiobacteraeota bacterium]
MDFERTQQLAHTVRLLAADGVQKANSGHPGMPMGTADMAAVLWQGFLHFDPDDPLWLNRDRFVLSAGHGSMLLYSLLHLFGFAVTLDDLKSFRQWHSRTPGHPEKGCLPGVECTTGPLGQGFGMGVGMALAAKVMANRFNTGDFSLINHRIYGIVSDGDLMEGISAEAASLAGHLKLDNLLYLYDSNRISIEGSTDLAFTEDVGKRFEAYGWKVFHADGHNLRELFEVTGKALEDRTAPKLIVCRTHIARWSPAMEDKAESHGSPLGAEEIKATKKVLGWPQDKDFYIPDEVAAFCRKRVDELKALHCAWKTQYAAWRKEHPDLAEKLDGALKKELPGELEKTLIENLPDKDEATRVSSGAVIQKIGKLIPFVMGGAADLEPSVKCHIKGAGSLKPGDFSGRNIHFGIREHGMGAILNGMALYGGIIPYGSTFLVFSDYMKPSVRLAAMMEAQVVFIFSHDSVFLGEDGPTHQPVEHLGALRIIPNLRVIRPADAMETAMAWFSALKRKEGPTALVVSRQNVPQLKRAARFDASLITRGGYILEDSKKPSPDVILLASGSEVHLAQRAHELLKAQEIDARIVSMPSIEVFLDQEPSYRHSVIPRNFARVVAIEASLTRDWDRFTAPSGLTIGLTRFGDSAPAKTIAQHYGFTPEKVAERVAVWLKEKEEVKAFPAL